MTRIIPEKLEFCGGCGVLLPIPEERTTRTPDNPDGPLGCPNCGVFSDQAKPIAGYFDPAEAERLRCL
jgi:hypothetical protein